MVRGWRACAANSKQSATVSGHCPAIVAELPYTPTGILMHAQYPEFTGEVILRSGLLQGDAAIWFCNLLHA